MSTAAVCARIRVQGHVMHMCEEGEMKGRDDGSEKLAEQSNEKTVCARIEIKGRNIHNAHVQFHRDRVVKGRDRGNANHVQGHIKTSMVRNTQKAPVIMETIHTGGVISV